MNLSLVVLAAGASRRFGAANKLLQLLDGKPLLCHTLELAAALPVMQRTAVCSVETAPLAEAAGFTVLLNPQPELGQSHSLRLGLAACRESDGCLFLTGDQPFLSVETLHRLINAWEKEPGGIWGCEFEGRFSIPSIFPAAVYGELLAQDGDGHSNGNGLGDAVTARKGCDAFQAVEDQHSEDGGGKHPAQILYHLGRLLVLGGKNQKGQKAGEHGCRRAHRNGQAHLERGHCAASFCFSVWPGTMPSACSMGLRKTSSSTRMQAMEGSRKLPEPKRTRQTSGTASPMMPL